MFDLGSTTLTNSTGPSLICTTPACHTAAERIKSNMDFNIHPCDDFYQYACGGWVKSHTLPPDRPETSTLSDMHYEHQNTLHDIISGTYVDLLQKIDPDAKSLLNEPDIDRSNFNQAKNYYDACMDEKTLTKLGPSPVYSSLSELLRKPNISEMMIYLSSLGTEPLYSLYVDIDSKNPTVRTIMLDEPPLVAPSREAYLDTDTMEKYRRGLVNMMTAIMGKGVNSYSVKKSEQLHLALWSPAEIETRVKQFVDMEIIISNLTVTAEAHGDPLLNYNKKQLTDVEKTYSFVEWRRIIQHFIPKTMPVPESLVMSAVSYFDGLNDWLKSSEDNGVNMIKNYLVMRYIYDKSSQLDPKTSGLNIAITNGIFNGVTTAPPRWRHCLGSLTAGTTFGQLMGRYFVMVNFGGESKRKRILDFLTVIHQSWERRLPKLTWLDEPTREKALDKLGKIIHKAAYGVITPDLRSPSSLRNFYAGITIEKTSYFENVLSTDLWALNYSWGLLGKPVDKSMFNMNPMEVNAYYSADQNEIVVAAGIVSTPFYDDELPDALNFGGLGMVVGHEITHAFDKTGRLFDGDGKMTDWWTNVTSAKFEEKAQCFKTQYSKFTVTDANGKIYQLNGNLTVNENLADNGGLAASFDAYTMLAQNKPQYTLPSLDLSAEQLLYLNYAQAWCGKATPQSQVNQVLSDVHSINMARINGVAQNSDQFSRIYQCQPNTPMNPSTKCAVW